MHVLLAPYHKLSVKLLHCRPRANVVFGGLCYFRSVEGNDDNKENEEDDQAKENLKTRTKQDEGLVGSQPVSDA
ncbi:hypothetical protein SOVF_138500 [Spinacia oleracea]|nr:hypothetical protein SOVF_138500 [Spinacia oleracea]